jgi:hypothetical protein
MNYYPPRNVILEYINQNYNYSYVEFPEIFYENTIANNTKYVSIGIRRTLDNRAILLFLVDDKSNYIFEYVISLSVIRKYNRKQNINNLLSTHE